MNMIMVPSPEHHGLGSGGTGLVSEITPLCRSVGEYLVFYVYLFLQSKWTVSDALSVPQLTRSGGEHPPLQC